MFSLLNSENLIVLKLDAKVAFMHCFKKHAHFGTSKFILILLSSENTVDGLKSMIKTAAIVVTAF